MIYYGKTLSSSGPKLTAVQSSMGYLNIFAQITGQNLSPKTCASGYLALESRPLTSHQAVLGKMAFVRALTGLLEITY